MAKKRQRRYYFRFTRVYEGYADGHTRAEALESFMEDRVWNGDAEDYTKTVYIRSESIQEGQDDGE